MFNVAGQRTNQKSKSRKEQIRHDHCQRCTQCEYWHRKIAIYQRKIDKHIELEKGMPKLGFKSSVCPTANFNSTEDINQVMNKFGSSATVASFGRQSSVQLITNSSKRKYPLNE